MGSEADQGITSPPYPRGVTTAKTLYRQLVELRQWVADQQGVLREGVPPKFAKKLAAPGNLPADTVWEATSVADQYTVFMYVRGLREAWDHTLREHEDSWDSRLALRKRYEIVLAAQYILDEAFVSPEVREMNTERAMHKARQRMKKLRRDMLPESSDEDEGEDEHRVPDEDWFSEEEEDDNDA